MKKRELGWKIITHNLEKLSERVNTLLKLLIKELILGQSQKIEILINKISIK